MRGLLVGLILGLLILPLAFFFYVINGKTPVAASDSPMPFEKFIAHGALHARIKKEAPERDVNSFTPADLASGVPVYRSNCAFCHGLPLQSPSAASQGMFPRPPQLFNEKESVTDDPVGVTYWKVKNGIRLSGMPGFQKSLSDQQMWQVSALVARADKLPPDVLRGLLPALGPGDVEMISGAPAAPAAPAPAVPPTPSAPNPLHP
jgi:thiosulfate dehydrogenase